MRRVSSEQNWDNDNVGRLDRASSKMLTLVSLLYNNEGKGGHRLLIDQLAEARLALHDAIGDIARSCALHLLLWRHTWDCTKCAI